MLLREGQTYKHKNAEFVGIYSHSDEMVNNHFFKIIRFPDTWEKSLIKDGMVSFTTFEVHQLLEEASVYVSDSNKNQLLRELYHEAYNAEDMIDGCFNPDDYRVIEDTEVVDAYNKALSGLRELCAVLSKRVD